MNKKETVRLIEDNIKNVATIIHQTNVYCLLKISNFVTDKL